MGRIYLFHEKYEKRRKEICTGGLVAPQRAEVPFLMFFLFLFVSIFQYLSLFVSICFMTNMKKSALKIAWVGFVVAPRRAGVPLWMILYFHLSLFVSICQYLFHDKYEKHRREIWWRLDGQEFHF